MADGSMDLYSLLNLDPDTVPSVDAFVDEFRRIAERVLNDYTLVINNNNYRLCEIEFYYCHPKHNDVFAHCDELQKTNAQWYFHRQNSRGYKSGNYKGLDITFAKPGEGYGGILIRAIQCIATGEYIEGSCLCVNRMLSLCNVNEIHELVALPNFKFLVSDESILWLRPTPGLPKLPVYSSSRVGLTLKQTNGDRPYFIVKPYRFITRPALVHKGRPNFILSLYSAGKSADEIITISKAGKKTVEKYIQVYEKSKTEKKTAADFKGVALSTDDLCRLHQICKT